MASELKRSRQHIVEELKKQEKVADDQVVQTIEEIVQSDPDSYKNLRNDLKPFKRVHIKGSFVSIFKYDKERQLISFFDYGHHDSIYKKRYGAGI